MTRTKSVIQSQRSRPVSNKELGKSNEVLRQLHINLPASLHKKLRLKAIEEDRSMNEVVVDLISNYLGQ